MVLVTVLDPYAYSQEFLKNIQDNRNAYAKEHGKHCMRISPPL